MFAALKRNPCSPDRREKDKTIRVEGREWKVPCETFVTTPLTPALERKGAKSICVTLNERFEGVDMISE